MTLESILDQILAGADYVPAAEILQAKEELAQLRKDAQRYRLLRETSVSIFGDTQDVQIPQNDGSYKPVKAPAYRSGAGLDEATDKLERE